MSTFLRYKEKSSLKFCIKYSVSGRSVRLDDGQSRKKQTKRLNFHYNKFTIREM